jgi:hypothetical protein
VSKAAKIRAAKADDPTLTVQCLCDLFVADERYVTKALAAADDRATAARKVARKRRERAA